MIIDELTLDDFGVYAGRQTIDLSPPSKSKPIVLIGGLNGGGKTTLLDAIQLCLYGKFAACSNRSTLGYNEFLRRCINQQDDEKNAAVELAFRHTVDGVEERYRIIRAWSENGKGISEELRVIHNGQENRYLAKNWTESVERILPRRIANLFFFDGENIETYASPQAASELIRTATHSLLGMDIVDQLERDLDTLKQRKRASTSDKKLRRELADTQQEFRRLGDERRACHQELAALRTHELGKAQKRLEQLELKFQQKGGDLFNRQKEIEAQLADLKQEIGCVEEELRDLAAGNLPLVLAKELVNSTVARAKEEDAAQRNMDFVEKVRGRDTQILDVLKVLKVSAVAARGLKKFFEDDIKIRQQEISVTPYLSLSRGAIAHTELELQSGFKRSEEMGQELIQRFAALTDQKRGKEAEIASVPAEEVIREIIISRADAQEELAEINKKIKDLVHDLKRLDALLLRTKQRLAKLVERRVKADFDEEDTLRVINHASRVQATLSEFRQMAVARHIGRIEKFVIDSFRSLHRKKNVINKLQIDPQTFAISLYGRGSAEISPDRLSAGERQLLAVAILWGLAQASSRQLPTIIDTPLGRLDSKHRGNLVDRYFPKASHQVILLSTDEEISNGYLTRLKDQVGKMYELVFDESKNATTIQAGYFELEGTHVH